MLYELYGRTIKIPDEIYFKLTDEELKDFMCNASGYEIQDPFYDSSLDNFALYEEIEDLEIEDIPKEMLDKDFLENDEI